jgi:hypothetical protein
MNMGTDNRGWGFLAPSPTQLAAGVTYWIVASKINPARVDTKGNIKITNES